MRTHVQLVGILHILMNVITIAVGALFLLLYFGILGAAAMEAPNPREGAIAASVFGTFGLLIGCACLLPSLPGFLGGLGLLKHRTWARVVVLVVSCLYLTAFPLGTALGVYSLWVLLHPETENLFRHGKNLDY